MPAPSMLFPATKEPSATIEGKTERDRDRDRDKDRDRELGLSAALLPSAPMDGVVPAEGGRGACTERLRPPPPVQPAESATSRLPDVAGAFQDVRDMLPDIPLVLGGRRSSAYDEI